MPDQRHMSAAAECGPGPGGAGLEAGRAAEELWARVHVDWLRLAGNTINAHVNDSGRCARCAVPWPCELARRAEFFLGAL